MSDIYCQLIPNEDDNDPYYQVMPRMGAFEVSVNGCVSNQQIYLQLVENALPVSQFKLRVQKRTTFFYYAFGHDFLILAFIIQLVFSKCLSGLWPHFQATAERCATVAEQIWKNPGGDLTAFQTTGKVKAQKRKGKPVEATKMPPHMQPKDAKPAAAKEEAPA